MSTLSPWGEGIMRCNQLRISAFSCLMELKNQLNQEDPGTPDDEPTRQVKIEIMTKQRDAIEMCHRLSVLNCDKGCEDCFAIMGLHRSAERTLRRYSLQRN